MSFTFECSHGMKETIYPQVTHDQILDMQLILYEELLKFALANPVIWERDENNKADVSNFHEAFVK